ncbi:LemA family protein [Leptospira sp. GIMC2001]|nr:LemA family protein [Leptospira sp. GIMC2001]WCL51397.1 LemA family protein [Leptospira sp. GIMC2001]
MVSQNCGYNKIQALDEQVNASKSEILNQYKRRADLIPGLVNIVKAYASHEKEVLQGVADARSRMGSIQMTPELMNDPAAFAKFQKSQGELSSWLSRLMMVTENYPNLKADQRFGDLQAQLEGTENRITVARNRYIAAVQEFNTTIRQFPTVLTAKMFGYDVKPNFTVENEAQITEPPAINFE